MQKRQKLTVFEASVHVVHMAGYNIRQYTITPPSLSLHASVVTAFCVIVQISPGWTGQSLSLLLHQSGDCARHDPLVTERWNSITLLLTRSHQCRRLVKKRPSMCYCVCVIMHVKDPQLSVVRVGHCVPLGFCLSLYDLHALKQGR